MTTENYTKQNYSKNWVTECRTLISDINQNFVDLFSFQLFAKKYNTFSILVECLKFQLIDKALEMYQFDEIFIFICIFNSV